MVYGKAMYQTKTLWRARLRQNDARRKIARPMKTKTTILTTIALAAPLLLAQGQSVQTTPTSKPTPALSPTEQTIQDIKNPTSWLSWGGDLRARNEYYNNAATLTSDPKLNSAAALHSQDYFRFRGRIWTSLKPVDDLSFNARLAAEPREWMEPTPVATYRGQSIGKSGFEPRYGIVDNLNVRWQTPFDAPLNITVGRQDITMGDGWLVLDGTPSEGSWTVFLDAARVTLDLKEQHTTVDVIGIVQSARPDEWLPTLGPSTQAGSPNHYILTEQNEKGAILWVANKSLSAANVDGYFIYKGDTRVNSTKTFAAGDNADIYTVGARFSGLVQEHLKYSAEGAYQWGNKQDPALNQSGNNKLLSSDAQSTSYRHLSAFGVNSKLTYLFKDPLNNQLAFAYEYLTGDDNATGSDEMFDVLWGRTPRWSEIYAVGVAAESRGSQMANYHRFGPSWSFTPAKNLDFSATYYALFTDQDVPTRTKAPKSFAGGDFRGQLAQTVLRYKFSSHLSGHLWGEMFFPGDFYTSHQTATFLRAELMLTF
jgi:hypothetical protein